MEMDLYSTQLQEIKNVERSIQTGMKNLKDNVNGNTSLSEQQVKKSLDSFSSKINKVEEEYKGGKIKYSLPEKEYNRRLNEIQELKQVYDKLNASYEGFVDNKYKYVRSIMLFIIERF